ncbi:helix-turn-helix transcriptional regulator [Enterobacter ludwigii]|nr:AlpA family phage regulatory protein [Enterobacter ludwigii]
MSTIDIHNDKFVSMQFITELTGLSDKWFYKLAQEGKFPKPVKFGRSSRWIEREVKEWLEERIRISRGNDVSDSSDGEC